MPSQTISTRSASLSPPRQPATASRRPGPRRGEPPRSRAGSVAFLFVILAAQLMVALDTTIVNAALPHIQPALGFSSGGPSCVPHASILMFGNVPIGVAIWLVGRRALIESPRRHGRFDMLGAIASTVGLSGIVLGLVESGSAGWGSPLTAGSLVAGVVLVATFVLIERRA